MVLSVAIPGSLTLPSSVIVFHLAEGESGTGVPGGFRARCFSSHAFGSSSDKHGSVSELSVIISVRIGQGPAGGLYNAYSNQPCAGACLPRPSGTGAAAQSVQSAHQAVADGG